MHWNDIINIKVRYNTLRETELQDEITKDGKESALKEIKLAVKHKNNYLFW